MSGNHLYKEALANIAGLLVAVNGLEVEELIISPPPED